MRSNVYVHTGTGELETHIDVMQLRFYKEYKEPRCYVIKLHGVMIGQTSLNESTLLGWFIRHTPHSMDWALKHGGYSVEESNIY